MPPTPRPCADPTGPVPALRRRGAARDAALHEAILGARAAHASRAATLTAVLEAGCRDPGAGAEHLGLADRQAALLRLALDVGRWPAWFTCRCAACDALVDLQVAASEFTFDAPLRPAPDGAVMVTPPPGAGLDAGAPLAFRIPDGADEAAIEPLEDRATALALTRRCAPVADLPGDPAAWAQAFEAALAPALPRFRPDLDYDCPECGAAQIYWFDPMDWIARHAARVFVEVHQLARAYGWPEPDILALSDARRAIYLDQIAAETGAGSEVRP